MNVASRCISAEHGKRVLIRKCAPPGDHRGERESLEIMRENKQLLAEYEEKLREFDKRTDELLDELRSRELKEQQLNKHITDLKEKLTDAESDRIKKDATIKEKDKLLSTSNKQAALELEEKKRELARR